MKDRRTKPTDVTAATAETVPGEVAANRPPEARPVLVLAYARGAFTEPHAASIGRGGLVIGRKAIVFGGAPLDDAQISRRHAEIGWERGRLTIRDLGSRNRTYVNGKEVVGSRPLAAGDVIRAGTTLLVVADGPLDEAADAADPEMAGVSVALAAVRRAVSAVARHDATVLVTGETGTGKELVARALHRESGRAGPFVAVNCGGLSEGVLESELFGHVRGSFTGAVASRPGLLLAADKGTLLLDELGEMPPSLQVKLLRVLETRSVRPIGGEQEIALDTRVVCATHRDVVAEVLKGSFRSDLYSRLAQWTIPVPPLRERREDIPSLARRLLARGGAEARPIDLALAEALLLHEWPLNVRSLHNVLSIAAIASPEGTPLSLSPQVEQALAAGRRLASGQSSPEVAEREDGAVPTAAELTEALSHFQGNLAEVARHFRCSRQQAYRWLAAHGLDLASFRRPASRIE